MRTAHVVFALLFLLKSAPFYAQTVVASSGGFGASAAGSVAFTLGEVRSGTAKNGAQIVTQGFQQPLESDIVSTDNEAEIFERLALFPNPTEAEITLSFFSQKAVAASWEILDETGRSVFSSEKKAVAAGDFSERIDLGSLAVGAYFFVLKTGKGQGRAARFVKI